MPIFRFQDMFREPAKTDAVNVVDHWFSHPNRKSGNSAARIAAENGGQPIQTSSTKRQSTRSPVHSAVSRLLPTETRIASFAPTIAILRTASEVEKKMNNIQRIQKRPTFRKPFGEAKQFQAEKFYYISVSITRSMLEKSIIDKATYDTIEALLLMKYHPLAASLIAGIS